MDLALAALIAPLFAAAIAAEQWRDRRQRRRARAAGRSVDRWYGFADSIANLGCGVLQQLVLPLIALVALGVYGWLFERLAPVRLAPARASTWALALVGADFLYYWFHRVSHRVNLVWATHVVHHQSEEYNLTVALRQSAIQPLLSAPFYWPLALAGVPTQVFVAAFGIDTLYQFWIHTRAIGRLPAPLEWALNTPSHHRVHHGINPEYIDKNYGGILIVWDRLFGTFAPERDEPAYGTVKPLASFDAVWANLDSWVAIARMSRAARSARDKLWAWFAPPEWLPAELGGVARVPQTSRAAQSRYRPPRASRALAGYVTAQFALAGAVSGALLVTATTTGRLGVLYAVGAALVAAGTVAWAALLERRSWARRFELARVLVSAVAAVAWLVARRGA